MVTHREAVLDGFLDVSSDGDCVKDLAVGLDLSRALGSGEVFLSCAIRFAFCLK